MFASIAFAGGLSIVSKLTLPMCSTFIVPAMVSPLVDKKRVKKIA